MSIKCSYEKRYNYGKEKEIQVLPIIKEFFKDETIIQSIKRYEKFDYKGIKNTFELKSRDCNYNDYPTSMIPVDKCIKDIILLFNFSDGLYYIEYDEEQFSKYEQKRFTLYQQNKMYYYIPIEDLKKINL